MHKKALIGRSIRLSPWDAPGSGRRSRWRLLPTGGHGPLVVRFYSIFLTSDRGALIMTGLPSRILQLADESAEGALLCANALLHLGTRGAVDQALSRLARSGELMRICQGVYVRPVQTRFGPCSPPISKVLSSLSALWGETIVNSGGIEANALGLTNQVPVRLVCLTSGSNRKLKFGRQVVELRHAPRWQLQAPLRPAGAAVRALAWLGPGEVEEGLKQVARRLSPADLQELAELRTGMPMWMAQSVSALVAHAQHAL